MAPLRQPIDARAGHEQNRAGVGCLLRQDTAQQENPVPLLDPLPHRRLSNRIHRLLEGHSKLLCCELLEQLDRLTANLTAGRPHQRTRPQAPR
jgi:hypothetical protein